MQIYVFNQNNTYSKKNTFKYIALHIICALCNVNTIDIKSLSAILKQNNNVIDYVYYNISFYNL